MSEPSLEEFCHTYNLQRFANKSTHYENRKNPSCIDLILTNKQGRFLEVKTTETVLSTAADEDIRVWVFAANIRLRVWEVRLHVSNTRPVVITCGPLICEILWFRHAAAHYKIRPHIQKSGHMFCKYYVMQTCGCIFCKYFVIYTCGRIFEACDRTFEL